MMNIRRGFTLVELLVVVAIILLLLSIMLPSIDKAVMLAERTQCLSNMGQVTRGALTYAAEQDYMVPRDYWPGQQTRTGTPHCLVPEVVAPYVTDIRKPLVPETMTGGNRDRHLATVFDDIGVYQCPSMPRTTRSSFTRYNYVSEKDEKVTEMTYDFSVNGVAYMNRYGWVSHGATKLSQIPYPSQYVYLTEVYAKHPIDFFGMHDVLNTSHFWTGGNPRMINDTRHGGLTIQDSGTNITHFDGSARFIHFVDLTWDYFKK